MSWFLAALAAPFFYGLANIIDNFFTNRLIKNTWVLSFYGVCSNLLFLPLTFLLGQPSWLPIHLWPISLIIGLTEVFYLYPYYRALQDDDTSTVTSLFSFGKIFVPVLAWLLIGEQLLLSQYLGFFIIVLAATGLTVKTRGTIRLNKSFLYMVICSFLISVQLVAYKYLFQEVSWGTGFFWSTAVPSAVGLNFLWFPKLRRAVAGHFQDFKRRIHLFVLEEGLTYGATACLTFALSRAPATVVEGIGGFQPFVVVIYALLFKRFFPTLFKEHLDQSQILKKGVLFAAIIVGIVLVS